MELENTLKKKGVTAALRRYVLAAILTAAACQLASTFDAIAVAQFIDIEAVSVLSLVMPVVVGVNCLGLLLGFGANGLCAYAIGRNDADGVSATFSTAIFSIIVLGLLASLLLWMGTPLIVSALTDDDYLSNLATDYLHVYVLGTWLEMLAYSCCLFMATDGHPLTSTLAVVTGVAVNAVVDVLTLGFFEMGMKGAAMGSVLQFAVTTLILSLCFHRHQSYCRLQWPGRRFKPLLLQNMKEGLPMSMSCLLMAITVFLVNLITYSALGEKGLFYWSVCLQMLLVGFIFINGSNEALFTLGGVMLGESDMTALRLLIRQIMLLLCLAMVALMALMATPNLLAIVFGVEEEPMLSELTGVLRVFSLMLIPFGVSVFLAFTYQIKGHIKLCSTVMIGHLMLIVLMAGLFAQLLPAAFWWSFPLASLLFLTVQMSLQPKLVNG